MRRSYSRVLSIFAAVLGIGAQPAVVLAAEPQLTFVQYGGPPQSGQGAQQEDERRRAQEQERQRAQEQQRRTQEQDRQRALEQQRRAQEQDRQRAQEQQRRAQEQDRQRALEQQRRAQEQDRQRAQEQQRRAQEQDRQRAQEQQRRAQEQERLRNEQQRASEQKKVQDEAQRRQLDEQKRAQEEAARRQQELQKKGQDEAQRHRLDEQRKVQEEAARRQQELKKAQDEALHHQQDQQRKAQDLTGRRQLDEQRRGQEEAARRQQEQFKAKEAQLHQQAEAEKRAVEEAKGRGDEARLRQLQDQERMRSAAELHLREEKQRAWQQHQEDVLRQSALQRQANAEYQRGLAEREAHRREQQQELQREREQAAREHSQAALNERLREENERLRTLREERRQTVDPSGQTIIREGNRTIYQVNNQYFIQHNDVERFHAYGDYHTNRLADGGTISAFVRPDGVRIELEADTYGRPLRRVRILPDGERYVLFENRPIEAGVGFAFGSFIVDLPPPAIDIPREQYIVDVEQASEDDIYNALEAPPVEPLDRTYTLDEVVASVHLRERMRSVNIDTIHFEFGSWEIGPDQADRLESVAAVIKNIVGENPREVFLIEGHTDAVGSAVDNLSLSDRRAEAVANLLSQRFGVPAENLVTRGYGKQFLLIGSDGPEWRNRRVVVRRITPLLSSDDARVSGGSYDAADRYR